MKGLIAALGIILFGPPPVGVPPPPVIFNLPEIRYEIATETPETIDTPSFAIETPVIAIKQPLNSYLCSCVAHSRRNSPYQPPRVKQASEIPVIQFTPKVGGWVLMNIAPYGHTAVITKILGDKIEITEANYPVSCKENKRIISIKDPTIRGYFWHDLS